MWPRFFFVYRTALMIWQSNLGMQSEGGTIILVKAMQVFCTLQGFLRLRKGLLQHRAPCTFVGMSLMLLLVLHVEVIDLPAFQHCAISLFCDGTFVCHQFLNTVTQAVLETVSRKKKECSRRIDSLKRVST